MITLLLRLEENQKRALQAFGKEQGQSLSALLREAVQEYLKRHKRDLSFEDAVKKTSGLWKDRDDIGDPVEYVKRMRRADTKAFDRRAHRFGL